MRTDDLLSLLFWGGLGLEQRLVPPRPASVRADTCMARFTGAAFGFLLHSRMSLHGRAKRRGRLCALGDGDYDDRSFLVEPGCEGVAEQRRAAGCGLRAAGGLDGHYSAMRRGCSVGCMST